MRITVFADASLRALLLLSAVETSAPLSARAISEAIGTPYYHTSKVVLRLRELGLLEATRGRAGGVTISPAGREVTVGGLLRLLDTEVDLAECEGAHGDCPLITECGLRRALRRAREAFLRELDGVVVSTLPTRRQLGPIMIQLGLES